MKTSILLLMFFSSILAQDDSITELFPGKWQMDTDKSEFFEEWELVNETELIGKSYRMKEGVKMISENIYLKKFADQWAYVAIPKSQTITLFALTEYSNNKFIFENKEHDFPQRIIYEFSSDGKLLAVVEGEVEGKIRREEFSFILVKN
ncbi:MAG: DUF6265 family protein [Ignavibacteriaceae bacterium]|nr:DUF6265 family protein [Ignavibacteriaceae bacterium]